MSKENRARLVEALRSGNFKQTRGHLRLEDCYCVLGVACEISGLGEWRFEGLFKESGEAQRGFTYVPFEDPHDFRSGGLPRVVREHYGFTSDGGKYRALEYASLTLDNDIEQLTFAQLADIIELEPAGMFKDA